ncbi:MAG: hypothetical protein JXJ19_07630 [Elusimicrobia bacterium]|nr:hypothetical protein [Elusimicrobiota bacterium]
MNKIIIIIVVTGLLLFFSVDFIRSGKCYEFINAHQEASWAPKAFYYLGSLFFFFQSPEKADEAFEKIIKDYYDSEYFEPAYYSYYKVAVQFYGSEYVIERGNAYMGEFPDSGANKEIDKKIYLLKKYN